MTIIYLHIGHEKTGTTSLQTFFSMNQKLLLRKRGVLYPNLFPTKTPPSYFNHAQFASGFLPENERSFARLPGGISISDAIAVLRSLINSRNPKKVILSCEQFSSRFKAEHIRLLKDSLDFAEVKVVSYLRRQDAYEVSRFSESLKYGETNWLDLTIKPKYRKLDYYANISPWAEAFSSENIILKIFEPSIFIGDRLYKDFLTAIDEEWQPRYTIPSTENTSISFEEASILIEANQYLVTWKEANEAGNVELFYQSQRMRKELLSLLKQHRDVLGFTPLSSKFSSIDKATFLDFFNDSNRKLAEKYLAGSQLFSNTDQEK